MGSANVRRLYNIATAVLLFVVVGWLWVGWRSTPPIDDAYMFARYAGNLRHGLGVSWNLNGMHTYGQTSLLWCAVVAVLSYLPMRASMMLSFASRLSAMGALVALAWAVAANAKSDLLRSTWRVLPWVALPLAGTALFESNAGSGMEAMLAALLCAVFVGLALGWRRGALRPEWVGLVGWLLFLTRPEAGIVVVLLPLLLFGLMRGVSAAGVARLLGVFAAGVAVELAACKLYFHTALPLSFYMKSWHAYEGYSYPGVWHPELQMMAFLGACELYLVALVFLGRRQDWRLIVCCLAPALATFAYLGTVTQISGGVARYYVPYMALIVTPALLVIDRWIVAAGAAEEVSEIDGAAGARGTATLERMWPGRTLLGRSCVAAVVMLGFLALSTDAVLAKVRHVENKTHYAYDPVRLDVAASAPLPVLPWDTMIHDIADLLVAPLPRGATVAASEVGYLGSSAPQVNIIDLEGLNDTEFALHGFTMSALLARRPDVIWMPDVAYTYQRGVMLSDPELLREYDVYAGAANYGLAIRKDSPYRTQIERRMQVFWNAVYPGYRMSDYLVRAASWTGKKHRIFE